MKKNADNLITLNASLLTDHQTRDLTEATMRVFGDADRLRQLATKWMNGDKAITQGFMFEQLEVLKFNGEAVNRRSVLHAATTDSIGQTNHQTTDVVIRKGNKIVKEFQLKSGNKPSSSAHMLADEKYASVSLVGPSDQTERIHELYERRIETGTLKADAYKSADSRLHQGLEADDVASGGTTYDEAINATDSTHADNIATGHEIKSALSDMHQSGIEAAKLGAITGAVFSVGSSILKYKQGDSTVEEISIQVISDTAKSASLAYLTTAGSKGIVHGLTKAGVSQTTVGVLSKSNAHVAIAAGVVRSGQSVVRYLNGDIDRQQLMSEISETATVGASAFYYGALGQAIIPIPVVGAMIGSTVGYFIGQILHQSGLIGLGEVAVVKAARKRREHIEAMCLEAIPLIRQHRIELDALLSKYFAARSQTLTLAFDGMEKSLISWDSDEFTSQLESVNQAFGKTLPFKTFDEFDRIMRDPTARLKF